MVSNQFKAPAWALAACLATAGFGIPAASATERGSLDGEPLIITAGDPFDPIYANAGANLRNGVGSIFIEFDSIPAGSGFICTASAIDATHILTAAHCVRNTTGAGDPDTVSRLRFILSAGLAAPVIIEGASFAVHPAYDFFQSLGYGAFAHGDIAVVELATPIPAGIETYELYRDTDEFGQTTRHYGHGRSGKGNKGATGGTDFFFARTGLNMYEQVLEPLLGDGIEDQLVHDFDSGGRKHNAMEWWYTNAFFCHPVNPDNPDQAQDGQCTTFKDGSYPDFKGFGKLEVGIAPGDSGGPGFIDGKIAGVHSFGFTHFCEGVTNGTDFSCGLNSSYGEMSGDTRVASYADWVDDVTGGQITPTPIPELVAAAASSNRLARQFKTRPSDRGKAFMKGVFSGTMRGMGKLPD